MKQQQYQAGRINGRDSQLFDIISKINNSLGTEAQRFLDTHAAVYNLFYLGRHLVKAERYRNLRVSAFNKWSKAAALTWATIFCDLIELICQNLCPS